MKLKDVCINISSGNTPSRKNKEFWSTKDIMWLKTKQVGVYKIYQTDEYVSNIAKVKVFPKNSVIVAMYGDGITRGKTSILANKMAVNQACAVFEVDNTKADYRFLYYYMYKSYNLLRHLSNGGAQQNLSVKLMKEFPFSSKSLAEQKRIADILTSLDDKIELNNQMNQTLEEMAKALYKQWFIDFEFPNEDGKPYKSSGGEMVKSELGLIPKGWAVYQLGEFIKFIKGKKPTDISVHKEEQYERYMTIKGISNSEILYANPTNTVEIQSDEICMVMDGASSGDVYTSIEGILGSTFAKIKTDLPTGFMFQLFKYHETSIKEHLTGSAIPHTDKGYVNKISIILPEISEIENLSENLELYTSLINRNKQNGEILEQQKQIILNEFLKD